MLLPFFDSRMTLEEQRRLVHGREFTSPPVAGKRVGLVSLNSGTEKLRIREQTRGFLAAKSVKSTVFLLQ
jgi:hypothetical protein